MGRANLAAYHMHLLANEKFAELVAVFVTGMPELSDDV